MSGHSKWSNIKHRKGKTDAQKAKVYTKIGREIAVVVKAGGPDPTVNGKLRDIIAKARANNMPSENVQRCIKKAAGGEDTSNYESIVYEGYGPGGVAVIVEALTDNRNRTAADVRHAFDKCGGNMGATGCVSWSFQEKGIIVIEKADNMDDDEMTMEALELDAQDIEVLEDSYEITTAPETFSQIREAYEAKGYTILEAEVSKIPDNYTTLTDEDQIKNMNKLIDMLEDNEDVQNIYHSWEE
ncbi:MAG: YebC/PmpR family DNA-binding transcriptional regulator [Clostridia bacterium]|nr:YebC/PmpR family DNA-binding transcriptional regulator [Clostridia bacterium]